MTIIESHPDIFGPPESPIDVINSARDSEWQPIETAPKDGYMLVHEDSAIRALLRIDGVWHKPGIPAIVLHPWGDVLVGDDARRLLPPGAKLELRDGCCDNPTHWMPLPKAPHRERIMGPIDSHGRYWVENRSKIIEAITAAGFTLMSDSTHFWLSKNE